MLKPGYTRCLLPALLLALSASVAAELSPRISDLGSLDREFMARQRQSVDDLARSQLGRQLRIEKANDLAILQALLDRRLVRSGQKMELQAMGVVMGDLLVSELGMKWIVYQDSAGRSRALQLNGSENVLFPITMISRRAEVGAAVDVEAIYAKAMRFIELFRRPLPFQ